MLRITVMLFAVMFLTSALILSVGTTYAQTANVTSSNPSIQTMSNQTNTNQTIATQSTNSTGQQTNDTKSAQQVSDFIHQAVIDFKQQGVETHQIIFDCRDKLQTASSADVDRIHLQCTTDLSTIKVKYQDERNHLHDLIKQYRQSVMVFLNDARGTIQVSKADLDTAISQLATMMHTSMTGNSVTGFMATKNNTHCVNPPGGPQLC